MARMPPETAVRFRVDHQMRRRLDRLRTEKAVNVSAWLRRLVRKALSDEFPDEELDEAPAPEPPAAPAEPDDDLKPDPQKAPIAGWTPRQLDQGWGAVLEGERVAALPESDQLRGTPILVTDRRGDTWTTTLTDVVSRSDTEIVVTNTGRPRR